MADDHSPSASPARTAVTAEALAAAFRPIKVRRLTPRGGGHNAGLRMAVGYAPSNRRTTLLFTLGDGARTAVGGAPRRPVVILIARIEGRPAIWLRLARKGEESLASLRQMDGSAGWQTSVSATGLDLAKVPSADVEFEPHPEGGVLIWPHGELGASALAIADFLNPVS